tara:strand:+ start:8941 stop:9372 length:432 start_codon:yes stop_codon:yes gene_type:complete
MRHTNFLIAIFFCLLLQGCISDKLKDDVIITADLIDPVNPPIIEFSVTTYDFDTVALGAEVEYTFNFVNKGKTPLLINSVKAGCGCTVLKGWPKIPIPPGEGGEIPVVLTTKRTGFVKKYISVLANTKPATSKLFLEGYVAGI